MTSGQNFNCQQTTNRLKFHSLSIRRFWGKGERWKRKRERGSPIGRPDTQAKNFTDNRLTRPEGDGLLEFHHHVLMNVRCNLVQHRSYTVAQILDLDDLCLLTLFSGRNKSQIPCRNWVRSKKPVYPVYQVSVQ